MMFLSWWIGKEPDFSGFWFKKVVFLDIDGVLNDEDKNRSKGVIIDSEMVRNLSHIIKETEAEIILSSSWRLDYKRFYEDNYVSDSKSLNTLHRLFVENGLTVAGTVPMSQWSGPSSRPAEIRTWLEYFPDVKYVILDDDDFWMWEKYGLRDHVVLTKRKIKKRGGYYDYVRGLTMEDSEKAIEILLSP